VKRKGWVGNSSTSSFVCSGCGNTAAGHNLCLADIDWTRCVNDHTLCYDCQDSDLEAVYEEIFIGEFGEEYYDHPDFCDFEDHFLYGSPEATCPICRFELANEEDLRLYFVKTTDITEADVFAKVKKMNRRRRKLYDSEYVMHVVSTLDIDIAKLLVELKERFETYGAFLEWLEQ